jgi:hypothetical protein
MGQNLLELILIKMKEEHDKKFSKQSTWLSHTSTFTQKFGSDAYFIYHFVCKGFNPPRKICWFVS